MTAFARTGRLGLAVVLLLCWRLSGAPAAAAEPFDALDLPLVPVGQPGAVHVSACALVATLACDGDVCALRVEQTYKLHNEDRARSATIRMGVPARPGKEPAQMSQVLLKDAQGTTLRPLGASAAHSSIWEVSLARDERKTLVLECTHPARAAVLFHWQWEMPLLLGWGVVDSVRVEFRLPQYITDDAFLILEPGNAGLDGGSITWQYEDPKGATRHEVLMLSPGTWSKLSGLRASGAHQEISRLYASIQEEARQAGWDLRDGWDQVLGELTAAIQADPENVATRMELAQRYRARSEQVPGLRLNYLLLAAKELAAVLDRQPWNVEVASALGALYQEAAMLAGKAGDPTGALAYLRKAEVSGSGLPQDRAKREELSLQWALDMAEQGRVSQAVQQIESVLAPSTRDALLRYAPPLLSAQIEVDLTPSMRVVRYTFRLYPPTAAQTASRLQEMATAISAVEGCSARLQSDRDAYVVQIGLSHSWGQDLARRGALLSSVLAADGDLLSTLLAAPWETHPLTYRLEHGFWADRYEYAERADGTIASSVWERQSQHARWRLMELRGDPARDERTRLEQRFAALVLEEQLQLWEQMPSGTYCSFGLDFDDSGSVDRPRWVIAWGQVRDLGASQRVYHWERTVPPLLLGLVVALVLGLASRSQRRLRA